jgi:hypothetical protein
MNPTPEQVKGLWDHMTAKYGTTVKSKADAEEMKLIAKALELIGILDADKFLTQFTTTIGSTIYVPFKIGVDSPGHKLWDQMVICAHEHQHVIQAQTIGFEFATRYLIDPTWRAVYEGEAYRVSMTMHNWHYGKVPPVAGYVKVIESYGVSGASQQFFEKYLTMSSKTLEMGGVPDEGAKVALDWLNQHAPQLQA